MTIDEGGAAVTLVFVAGVVAMVAIGSVSLGLLYVGREKATTAAEAAALAAAVATYPMAAVDSPISAAAAMAERNGARLNSCQCPVDRSLRVRTVRVFTSLVVTVPLFGDLWVKGGAAAEFDPVAWLGG